MNNYKTERCNVGFLYSSVDYENIYRTIHYLKRYKWCLTFRAKCVMKSWHWLPEGGLLLETSNSTYIVSSIVKDPLLIATLLNLYANNYILVRKIRPNSCYVIGIWEVIFALCKRIWENSLLLFVDSRAKMTSEL